MSKNRWSEMSVELGEVREEMQEFQVQISDFRQDIEQLITELAEIETDLNSLRSKVDGLATNYSALVGELSERTALRAYLRYTEAVTDGTTADWTGYTEVDGLHEEQTTTLPRSIQ